MLLKITTCKCSFGLTHWHLEIFRPCCPCLYLFPVPLTKLQFSWLKQHAGTSESGGYHFHQSHSHLRHMEHDPMDLIGRDFQHFLKSKITYLSCQDIYQKYLPLGSSPHLYLSQSWWGMLPRPLSLSTAEQYVTI